MKFLSDIDVEQGADATFVDNAKALFGTGNDLQIYHDASNSYIDQTGTGKIILNTASTGINVQSGTGETRFTKSGADSEIKIDDSSQASKVVLKANGDSYLIGGDVGIGTSSIDSIFHIKDTGKLTTITIQSDVGGGGGISFRGSSATHGSVTMDANGAFRISNTNTGFLLTGDAAPLLGLGVNNSAPTQQLHLNGNIRVEGFYYDSTGTTGSPGTAGQVLSATSTGTEWKTASGGGGGTIGGSTTATEIAFGSSTASEIDSSPGLTYTTQGGLLVKNTAGGGSSKITMRKGTSGNCLFEMQEENPIGTYSAKFFVDLNTSEDTEITATGNLTLQNKVGTTKDIILNPTANLGIGTTTPESKLQVAGGIQMGTDGAADDIAAKAGTLRYREVNGSNPTPKANYSYIDMYMRTGSSSYEWVNIVTNNW